MVKGEYQILRNRPLVGPPKVKARKSFLFTEKFPWIKNKEHLLDFVVKLLRLFY